MEILLAASDTGGSYVAVAYLVFVAMLVVYLAIMANKLVKMQRRVSELQQREQSSGTSAEQND